MLAFRRLRRQFAPLADCALVWLMRIVVFYPAFVGVAALVGLPAREWHLFALALLGLLLFGAACEAAVEWIGSRPLPRRSYVTPGGRRRR